MDFVTNERMRTSLPLFNVLAGVLLVLTLGTILKIAKDPIVHLALAILLSFALAPIVRVAERYLGRGLAILLALCATLALVTGFFYLTFVQLTGLANDLPAYEAIIQKKLMGLVGGLQDGGPFGRAADAVTRIFASLAPDPTATAGPALPRMVIEPGNSVIEPFLTLAKPVLQPIAALVIVLLLAGFLLFQREDLRNRVIKLMGTDDLRLTTLALDDAGQRVGRVLLSQLALNTGFGTIIAAGLWIIGVPSPLLWGLFAGVLRFVPYIGAIIGVIPPLLLAFAIDPGWSMFVLTATLFLIVEPLVGHVVEPILYGESAGVSPVAIVILATFWAFLWGPIGLVLSAPLTICLMVMGRHFPRLQFLEILLGDRPALQPDEVLYQRWLSGDVMGERYRLKRRGITQLDAHFDTVALPAMQRAHLDLVRGHFDHATQDKLVLATKTYAEQLRSPAPVALRDKTGVCAIIHGDQPLDSMMASLLAVVLSQHGMTSNVMSIDEAAQVTAAQAEVCQAVIMSFVEPASTLHLRAYLRRVSKVAPKARTLLAIWQPMDGARMRTLRKATRASGMATSFADVQRLLTRWVASTPLNQGKAN